MRAEAEASIAQAWYTAAFALQGLNGKLPALETVLRQMRAAPTRLPPAAQRAQVAMLAEHIGGTVIPISESTKRALMKLRIDHGR